MKYRPFTSTNLKSAWRDIVAVSLCLFAAGAITALVSVLARPTLRNQMAQMAAIHQLQKENMQLIEVFDQYGKKRIARITDPDSLSEFARGISDAVGHAPNHPSYTESWYLVVDGTTRHEFELHLDPLFPQSVIGYSVEKSGTSTSFYVTFESKGLRSWVETQLMKNKTNMAIEDDKK